MDGSNCTLSFITFQGYVQSQWFWTHFRALNWNLRMYSKLLELDKVSKSYGLWARKYKRLRAFLHHPPVRSPRFKFHPQKNVTCRTQNPSCWHQQKIRDPAFPSSPSWPTLLLHQYQSQYYPDHRLHSNTDSSPENPPSLAVFSSAPSTSPKKYSHSSARSRLAAGFLRMRPDFFDSKKFSSL